MKNSDFENSILENKFENYQPRLIKAAIIVFATILIVCVAHAQQTVPYKSIGFGAELSSGGNGHGAFLSPYVSFVKNDHSLILSPLLLKENSKCYGGKLAHSINLSNSIRNKSDESEPVLQLNAYSYLQYLSNCPASYKVVRYENIKRKDGTRVNNTDLSTAEAGAGIEIRVNLTNSISVRNCIGLSFYRHLGQMDFIFQQRSGAHLNLSTGLQFVIN